MLRINLLPRTINENARKKTFVVIWALANAAVIALFLMWYAGKQAEYALAKDQNDQAHSKLTTYQGLDNQIQAVNTQIADTKSKEDFVASAQKYNDGWPAVFSLMRDVTSDQVLLHSLNIDPAQHKVLSFAGFAPNEEAIIRWWMYLRLNKDKFESVYFNLPPHAYTPGEMAAAGGMGTGNALGMMPGGMRPGMGGMTPGGMGMKAGGMPGMGMSGMPGMGMSGPPGMPGGMRPGMGGMTPGGMGGNMMGRGGGGGGSSAGVGPGIVEGRKGIEFTAMAVLREPMAGGISAPTWPASGGGGTAGFGGGMPGMGMSGPPGMPGMGMSGPPPGMMGGMRSMGGPPAGGAAPPAAGGLSSLRGKSSDGAD